MKTGTPFKFCILLVLIIISVFSCKKTDLKSVAQEIDKEEGTSGDVVNRFFTEHFSGDPKEVSIINYLKRKNEQLQFVEKTVKQIGYPYWDKAISLKKKGTASHKNNSSDSTDIFYIPFVRDGEDKVNASMILKSTSAGDTSFTYTCDWQYTEKDFGSVSDINSADNHAMFFMVLDNLTLGHDLFEITDLNLFDSLPVGIENRRRIGINGTQTNTAGKNALFEWQQVCVSIFYCATPGYCGPSCDFGACPGEGSEHCSGSTYCEGGWVDTGGGTGGEGGGPGSGGGGPGDGTGLPPNCNGEVIPGNTAGRVMGNAPCNGGGGGGWVPVPIDDEEPPKPCDPFMQELTNSATFIANMGQINSSEFTLRSYESGYKFGDINQQSTYVGQAGSTATSPNIVWNITTPIAGLIHQHFNGANSIFSPDDMIFMARIFRGNLAANPSHFFFGVTSHENEPYIVLVEDPVKFAVFAEKIAGSERAMDKLNLKYKKKLADPNPQTNENAFFEMMKEYGDSGDPGFGLYRGSGGVNNWVRITKGNFNTPDSTNCN